MSEVKVEVPGSVKSALATVVILAIVLVVALAFLGFVTASWDAGEVGVLLDPVTNSVNNLGPGPKFVLKLPWQYVVKVPIRILSLDMWTDEQGRQGEWPGVTVYTSDGLQAVVDITVQYSIRPEYADEVYRAYPSFDWEERTLAPTLRQIVRDIIAMYKGIDTIPKREEIAARIQEEFMNKLPQDVKTWFLFRSINLRNIRLPQAYIKAIEEKLAAEQAKIKAQFEKERIEIEAQAEALRKMLEAEGEKNATILRAQGEAQAILLKADAEARARMLVANASAYEISVISLALGDPRLAADYLKWIYLTNALGNATVVWVYGCNTTAIPVVPVTKP